jgi:hypothetical protein
MVKDSADLTKKTVLGPVLLQAIQGVHEKLGARFDIEPDLDVQALQSFVHIAVRGYQQDPVRKHSLY